MPSEDLEQPGDDGDLHRLIESLGDPDAGVRSAAARALGELGDARALGPLAKTTRADADSDVSGAASEAFIAIASEETMPQLAAILANSDENLTSRILAAEGLESIGAPAIGVLTDALAAGEDVVLHDAVVKALRNIGGPEAERVLAEWVVEARPFSPVSCTKPEEAAKALFDEALPAAGRAPPGLVEQQFLSWQDSSTVYRGDRDQVRAQVLADLQHMHAEPGFGSFKIQVNPRQNAGEILCFMNERSRFGSDVGVPVRVWPTGETYVASGIDPSWR